MGSRKSSYLEFLLKKTKKKSDFLSFGSTAADSDYGLGEAGRRRRFGGTLGGGRPKVMVGGREEKF